LLGISKAPSNSKVDLHKLERKARIPQQSNTQVSHPSINITHFDSSIMTIFTMLQHCGESF